MEENQLIRQLAGWSLLRVALYQGLRIGLRSWQVEHAAAAAAREAREMGMYGVGPTSSLYPSTMAAPFMSLLHHILALGPFYGGLYAIHSTDEKVMSSGVR